MLSEFKFYYQIQNEIHSITSIYDGNYQKIKTILDNLTVKINADPILSDFSKIILSTSLTLSLNAKDYPSLKKIIHAEKVPPHIHKQLTIHLLTEAERLSEKNPEFLNEIIQ